MWGRVALARLASNTVSACHRDWVLEDLVAVEAIDRFYQSCPEHIPAREEISYVPEKKGRRLVIGGVDKIALVDWLSKFAKPSDLFGVIQQMVLVRQELALAPIEIVTLEHKPSSFGLRPEPWWFVQ